MGSDTIEMEIPQTPLHVELKFGPYSEGDG